MQETKKYEKRIIGFIDLLGFKNLLDEEENFEIIQGILRAVYEVKEDIGKIFGHDCIVMSTVSDSIIISANIEEKGAFIKLNSIVYAFVSVLLCKYGILSRGAITYGNLYHDGQIAFGPALVKAYLMERDMAVYPRIILDEDEIEAFMTDCSTTDKNLIRRKMKRGEDGWFYLDIFKDDKIDETENILRAREQVEKNLKGITDKRIRQKWMWMKNELE